MNSLTVERDFGTVDHMKLKSHVRNKHPLCNGVGVLSMLKIKKLIRMKNETKNGSLPHRYVV